MSELETINRLGVVGEEFDLVNSAEEELKALAVIEMAGILIRSWPNAPLAVTQLLERRSNYRNGEMALRSLEGS
jgi:hypothetical protein